MIPATAGAIALEMDIIVTAIPLAWPLTSWVCLFFFLHSDVKKKKFSITNIHQALMEGTKLFIISNLPQHH